ncbi:SepM family pheromone-processing serine protease [Calidifontibacillus erzurumensis]|uniref:SepM family pheromone-processing serine protease n=1 Tax=Calidifontibacillus erzurumensis TaxID=2741433 RepID=UPI001E3BAA27|nr:SepM family pheromone-processing serine protease [Calidifontibacillus erzurumensis]
MNKRKKILKPFIAFAIVTLFLTFFPLPYYISAPGSAMELNEIVKVEGGNKERGSFSLTTVRIGKATFVQYAWAKMNNYYEIYPESYIIPEGESEDDYSHRQLHMMENSKEQATVVAYTKAKKDIKIDYNGVYVMSLVAGMPAEKKLKVGDRLFSIDGQKMKSAEEFTNYLSKKKKGDIVTLKLERDEKIIEVKIPIAVFPKEKTGDGQDKVGLGIILVTDRKVTVNPPVEINTDKIGGPSAGLMFALEIYNQLIDEDLTKGYKIAGTGTIGYDGKVGRIGGIAQKIVAADKAGIEIFFAPNEQGKKRVDPTGKPILTNYQEALQTAKEIHSQMKIIPVDTFDEAVLYLQKLQPKD